jgi:plasmid maintenance system antidote protein VapI
MLTLLWAVTLTAFSTAVNARGPARITLSYFFAILCLCASIFHTIQGVLTEKAEESAVLEAPVTLAGPDQPVEPVTPMQPSAADTAGLAASQQAAAMGVTRNELRQIVEQGRRLAERLSAVDLSAIPDLSDTEYDAMQNKSFGYRSEVGKLKERLNTLGPAPEPLKAAQNRVQTAVTQLGQSAQAYDRFFKAENDDEESERMQTFQSLTRAALSALKQVENELSAP